MSNFLIEQNGCRVRSLLRLKTDPDHSMWRLIPMLLILLFFLNTGDRTHGTDPAAPPQVPDSINPALAKIPTDFSGIIGQQNIDQYSWLTFIALNWPADPATCGANTNLSILSGKGPVVWETYLQDSDVFVAPGSNPAPWCAPLSLESPRHQSLPSKVKALARKTGVTRFLH